MSGAVTTRVDGMPVPGAVVSVVGADASTVTDANGRYTTQAPNERVRGGRLQVKVDALGLPSKFIDVAVDAATLTVDVALTLEFGEHVTVGSRAAGALAEKAVPVDVITRDQIASSGYSETTQIIQALTPPFNFPRPTVSDATDTVRPATLRGLGPDQVLVLINGKRRHQSALVHVNDSIGRGSTGVDLNAIPVSAIDHIEVLRDGAAAQYGSGVPLNSPQTRFLYAFGGYSQRTANSAGFYRRALDARNWPQIYPLGFLPVIEPTVVDTSATVGVRGLFSTWTYDVSGEYGHNSFDFTISETLNVSLGPSLPPNKTQFDAGALALNQFVGNVDLSRPFRVRGLSGPLNIAVGAEYRRENYRIAWQVGFLVIGRDPARFRPMMIPAVLEKFIFVVSLGALYAQGRVRAGQLAAAGPDLLLGVLFIMSFLKVGADRPSGWR